MLPNITTPDDSQAIDPRIGHVLELVRRGILSIDDEGRIWRHATMDPNNKDGIVQCETRRAEKVDKDGYYIFRWSEGNHKAKKQAYSHRVVYTYFFGVIVRPLEVNHKDGVKTNNRPDNFELLTRGQNVQHAYEAGLHDGNRGENKKTAKLTNAQVIEMRAEYKAGGVTHKQLASKYGVAQSIVSGILAGTRWKSLLTYE